MKFSSMTQSTVGYSGFILPPDDHKLILPMEVQARLYYPFQKRAWTGEKQTKRQATAVLETRYLIMPWMPTRWQLDPLLIPSVKYI